MLAQKARKLAGIIGKQSRNETCQFFQALSLIFWQQEFRFKPLALNQAAQCLLSRGPVFVRAEVQTIA